MGAAADKEERVPLRNVNVEVDVSDTSAKWLDGAMAGVGYASTSVDIRERQERAEVDRSASQVRTTRLGAAGDMI